MPEVEKRWQRYTRSVGASWRAAEAYIKLRGRWGYLYRGVDKEGQTLAFSLSEHRDIAAAKHFLRRAIEEGGVPQQITSDGYAASHVAGGGLRAEGGLPATLAVRTNRPLNNVIEQDRRRVNQRVNPMLGFKRFAHAAITLSGLEAVHQIKKDQCDLSALCTPSARPPRGGEAVLAA